VVYIHGLTDPALKMNNQPPKKIDTTGFWNLVTLKILSRTTLDPFSLLDRTERPDKCRSAPGRPGGHCY
jgi:hypothetical protein